MKIVSITPDIDSGGAAKSLFLLARQTVKDGHDMHIISIVRPSRTKRKVEALRELGVQVDFFDIPYFPLELYVCPIPFRRNVMRTLKALPTYRQLADRVRELRPDVVHYNSYTTLLIAQWLKGFPSLLHAREVLVEPSWFLPVVRPLMRRRIHEVIAISPEEREQAERLFNIPATAVFNWPEITQELTPMPPAEPLVYGMFSHVTPIKGHLECVKAVALVADKLRQANVRVRLFGGTVPIHEGYYREAMDTIQQADIGDIVEFPGFVDNPEEEMRRVHLVLHPDTTGHVWDRDIIEAMSLGRPVLATGESEVMIRNGVSGKLTPTGDLRALADGMVEMANIDLLRDMGNNAYQLAIQHFNPVENPRRIIRRMEHVMRMAS